MYDLQNYDNYARRTNLEYIFHDFSCKLKTAIFCEMQKEFGVTMVQNHEMFLWKMRIKHKKLIPCQDCVKGFAEVVVILHPDKVKKIFVNIFG